MWSDVHRGARNQMARLEEAIALTADAFAFYDANDRLILGNALYAQLSGGVKTLDGIRWPVKFTEIVGRVVPTAAASCWTCRRKSG